jgi:hypothetical protein
MSDHFLLTLPLPRPSLGLEENAIVTLTQTELLRRPGWTRRKLRALLGDPDYTRRNPYYPRGARVQLFDFARVLRAEQLEAFGA